MSFGPCSVRRECGGSPGSPVGRGWFPRSFRVTHPLAKMLKLFLGSSDVSATVMLLAVVACACHAQELSQWTSFGNCITENDPAGDRFLCQRYRYRSTTGGEAPPGAKLEEVATCTEENCARDCEMSEWSEWSTCDCEPGSEAAATRSRQVLRPAFGQGARCSSFAMSQSNPCSQCGDPELTVKDGNVILSAGRPGRTVHLSLSNGHMISGECQPSAAFRDGAPHADGA